ncbi:unnamed protein product [Symbiodinium sp. CCMP2592]|nr:unnamed protein product [Symbiodinium sp. CCMP2592]
MWSKLPEGTDLAALLLVGGNDGLDDTMRLRQVSRRFQGLAEHAAGCHLHDVDPTVRMEALKAAIHAAENGNLGKICGVLGRVDDENAAVRQLATSSLAYLLMEDDHEAPAARAAGVQRLLDSDGEVRSAARMLLGAVAHGHEAVVSALAGIMQSREEDWLRQEAVEALSSLASRGNSEALAAVVRGLADPSLAVRREAVAALGDVAPFCDREGTTLLCQCCTDPDPTVRCALAHASTIISPWGDPAMTAALVGLLQDTHAEVRVRAVIALGTVARPSDRETIEAVEACAEDADERVRSAAQRSLALLAPPALEEVTLPSPEPIEGVKSKKAALWRAEAAEAAKAVPPSAEVEDRLACSITDKLLGSRAFICLSRSSRVVLEGCLDMPKICDLLAGHRPDAAPLFWRHPRARFAAVSPRCVTQLCQENSCKTPRDVLHAGYEYLACDIEAHLSHFALADFADRGLAELTRCQKVLLTFAKAFWPRAPHVLFVCEPGSLGAEGAALTQLMRALGTWSGGVLVAGPDSALREVETWERWSLA